MTKSLVASTFLESRPSRGTLAAHEAPLDHPAGAGGLAPTPPPPIGGSRPPWERKKALSIRRVLFVTSQEGFEPPTDGLEGRCSIQLSYWDTLNMKNTSKKYYIIGSVRDQ